ncbi:proton-conducting transporter transmembrane domain-containing protein [Tenacibaculum aquimarinum]|mgnify:CR=1 FL=1|uniref:proton-conducting transporter transmembrane domain-containing protein n=1 Tax=Tenacibaculum aquimarinum TaxID=2910675 RepID=UPI001F0A5BB8|nr:proton-conducting transporter membrane subunit [Tenacibaculum aquimarinum]MCH3884502.1 hypothetical protein [Tenacibaculum aquimarinum]
MEELLLAFVGIPGTALLLSLFIPEKNENALSRLIIWSMGAYVVFTTLFIVAWAWFGFTSYNVKELYLYRSEAYNFFIDFYFDKVSAVYLLMAGILSYLISVYSRVYLHKEPGYKRFFITFLVFFISIQIIVLSGNFETLFVGWEILGVTSFLLIAFYRHRYLPVRNGMKVFSMYRVADVGILLTMWLSHHLWHENITFLQLNNSEAVSEHLLHNQWTGVVISLCIVLAACVKSAQFPFSSWLPRAMEGPTPSSAIFYGSIAAHIGVFLLLRTAPFWSQVPYINIVIIAIGAVTALMATVSAQVQYSVKAQIAYASVAQIGLIFVEVALGFHTLALIHLVGNAFFRSYQLLISPSVVAYAIREQFYQFQPVQWVGRSKIRQRLDATLYILGLNEWKLDSSLYKLFWNPIKAMGKPLTRFAPKPAVHLGLAILPIPFFFMGSLGDTQWGHQLLPLCFGAVGLLLVIRTFAERKDALLAWVMLAFAHIWVLLAVFFNEHFSVWHFVFYISGVLLSGVLGYVLLYRLKKQSHFDLNDYYGLSYKYPTASFLLLLCCLGLMGFPITTTFIGEDLLFTHIEEHQLLLAALMAFNFILSGISIMRLYSRIAMGPFKSSDIPTARRSS